MPKKINQSSKSKSEMMVRKRAEFDLFIQWLSLPSNLRGKPRETLVDLGMEGQDLELLAIRTQTEFAEVHGVNIDTLTGWKKKAVFNDQMIDLAKQRVFHKYYGRVLESFTLNCIKHGDAARFEKWMTIFAGESVGEAETPTEISSNIQLEAKDIANIVATRLKRTRGITIKGDIEDINHVEILPSDTEYDFGEIEKKHRANGVKKDVKDAKLSEEAKSSLQKAIEKAKKTKK